MLKPDLFNINTGLLPDMTIRIPQAREPQFDNSRLSQIAFHELSLALHYQRVAIFCGSIILEKTLSAAPVNGNPYGDGGELMRNNDSPFRNDADFLWVSFLCGKL